LGFSGKLGFFRYQIEGVVETWSPKIELLKKNIARTCGSHPHPMGLMNVEEEVHFCH
jgi:hypothetical protein